jgi:hypothetical protein
MAREEPLEENVGHQCHNSDSAAWGGAYECVLSTGNLDDLMCSQFVPTTRKKTSEKKLTCVSAVLALHILSPKEIKLLCCRGSAHLWSLKHYLQ